MKTTINFLVLISGLLLANIAHAETPREQLQQMVEQLQKTPNDNALREKIIKLAPTLKPSPALPDAAVTFEGRAQFAFRSAKSEDDFLAAAREYEKAVAAAPWVPGYYTDLCTIYEKAGKFEDAKRHCGFFLSGLTDPSQMTDVKRRIAGLEFGIEKTEKANSLQAREAREAAKEKEAKQRFITSLEGAKYICVELVYRNSDERWEIEIFQGKFIAAYVRLSDGFRGVWTGFTKPQLVQGSVSQWSDTYGLNTEITIHDDRLEIKHKQSGQIVTNWTCRRQ